MSNRKPRVDIVHLKDARIRFGRVGENRTPKNTLATVRRDGSVYFGISRCLLSVDRPDKNEGKRRAFDRLAVALSNKAGSWVVDGSFYLHKSGLFGQVGLDEVKKLLEYFDNIDEISRKQRGKR